MLVLFAHPVIRLVLIMSKIIITSDVHLSETQTHINRQFIEWLHHLPTDIDHLYILGDLFDAWTETEYHAPWLQPILQALRERTTYHPISLMYGNHDFLISQRFFNLTGLQLISSDTLCLTLLDQPTILMHGDSLATDDLHYQSLRKWIRKPSLKRLYTYLPKSLQLKLATVLKKKSNQAKTHKTNESMQPTTQGIEQAHQQHPEAKALICGHFHRKNSTETTYHTSIGPLKVTIMADWASCQTPTALTYSLTQT